MARQGSAAWETVFRDRSRAHLGIEERVDFMKKVPDIKKGPLCFGPSGGEKVKGKGAPAFSEEKQDVL